jgi:hypothetical protein
MYKKIKRLLSNLKSQGISVNTMIIAAIALVVLIVLVMIFSGRIGKFDSGIDEVTAQAQECTVIVAKSLGYNKAEIQRGSICNGKKIETKETIKNDDVCCLT